MDYETIKPLLSAAGVGLMYAWIKYRSNILDPTKETPEKFEVPKAASTVILAVVISIFYALIGQTLDIDGLTVQMGVFAGVSTAVIEPFLKAAWRWYKDQKTV